VDNVDLDTYYLDIYHKAAKEFGMMMTTFDVEQISYHSSTYARLRDQERAKPSPPYDPVYKRKPQR